MLTKIEQRQQHGVCYDDGAEAPYHPGAQSTFAPGKEQAVTQIDQNVAEDGLQAARRNDQRGDASGALHQIEDERRDVAQSGDERQDRQATRPGIDQRVVRHHGEHHKQGGKYQGHLKLQRIAAVFLLQLAIDRHRTARMDVPSHTTGYQCHNEQIGINDNQRVAAENAYQNKKTQEHHTDGHQHCGYILWRFISFSFAAFAGKDGNSSRAAVESADDTGHQDARLTEHVAT